MLDGHICRRDGRRQCDVHGAGRDRRRRLKVEGHPIAAYLDCDMYREGLVRNAVIVEVIHRLPTPIGQALQL